MLAPLIRDKSGHDSRSVPLALVTARSIDDVQAFLRTATEHAAGVVTRGAGTGFAGGSIASAGQIVLSTLAMNQILEIFVADELAIVEPGILNGDLNAALASHGLWFTPDPAGRAISTVGGNIATNAGGMLCAKYGVTREVVLALQVVLALKVVLADGRLLTIGYRSVNGVTSLDLTALMIGSESTLGVIVEATVRLRPLPTGPVATVGAWFGDVVTAAAACAGITAAGIRPAALERIDAAALTAIDAYLGEALSKRGNAFLFLQADGEADADEAAAALEIIQRGGGDVQLTADPAEGERLFAIRRAFHSALEAQGAVLIEDVAVPRSTLPQIFTEIARIGDHYGISIPTAAHAGDGNLHPTLSPSRRRTDPCPR